MCPIAMLLCPIAIKVGVRLVPIGHLLCVKYAKCEIFVLRVASVVTTPLTETLATL